jgi:hypothetical protein
MWSVVGMMVENHGARGKLRGQREKGMTMGNGQWTIVNGQ